jgi:hypothetical protein
MKSKIIFVFIFVIFTCAFSQTVSDSGKAANYSRSDFDRRASIFSPSRFGQKSALSVGYFSSGSSSGSILSYFHSFDYALKPNLMTSAAFQLARINSNGVYRTELLTSLKLGWKPTKSTSFTLDLRLPPQTLSGSLPGPFNQGR